MINFNQNEDKQKIGLNTKISLSPSGQGQPIEANPVLTKEIIEEEKAFRRGVLTVRDIISPASLQVTPKYLRLGSKFVRTIFVIGYPRYISVGWFAPIINLNLTFDISMFFYPVKSAIILKQLKNKVGVLEAQIISDAEKGAARDPLRETALRDIEYLRDALTQGTEKFFQFSLYVTLYSDSLEELDRMSDQVEDIFGSRLVYSRRVYFQAEQGFNSTLPLGNDELYITFNMNSSPIASSFPFISSELTSDRGILYGINRHNNSLILFDRFSLQNANSVVFATSGAGKSYAIKLEILRSLMLGSEIIVIDPEYEYKHLAEAVGGTYINISLASENKINPFDLPRAIGGEAKPKDIIRSAVITLKGLVRLMLGKLNYDEDSIVDRALLETYAKKDITPDSDLSTIEAPIMSDFEQVLDGMEGGADLALRLKKYTEGTFAGLLNSVTNVEMNNQLVCFSVRDLEDELRPLAIYTIVNYIWNIVRSEMRQRILVIDEAWWMMQNEDSAKFIFALVKRCRKYYLGVTTITQDVNDFLSSPYGQAIVTNSSLQILLKQSPAAIDLVQKTFLLTEGEKYLLLECGVGEGIFFAGNKHVAMKVVASYAEDQLITSDPRQLLEIEEAKKEFNESLAEGQA
ncbi:MAG TPA: ATP-binding protein [bacterium]|nr:MAG: AAA-like domain protein [Parcubacteria group bacterium ADurb.Bin115]HNU81671.1 ATP-binding protein [bacterium]HOD87257.1 ATP-binding protein [bacterium]HPW05848.1 ATP-binding protein [bacterium]HPY99616.1 ATP-binding protein [bacterium]